jgi:adenosylhomocysteine nucleosidase
MICFAFPLAHEAESLLKLLKQKDQFVIDGVHCAIGNLGRRPNVLIARIGMGEARAADSTETLFQHFKLKCLILAGYGGALVPPLKVGQVVVSSNLSSEAVLGFLRMFSGFDFASFCTVDEIVGTPEARDAVARAGEGQVADMETEAVANVVITRQVPFLAVRAISDAHGDVLPMDALAAGFNASLNKPTPLRFLRRLAIHPGEIAPMSRFIGNLGLARKNLTRFLQTLNNELPAGW